MIACIVVISTMYAFLLPAITLGETAECGIEEHQHDESCYEEQLICGQEESGEHQHTDDCCRKVLTCGKEVHIHSQDCFQDRDEEETAEEAMGMYGAAEESAGMYGAADDTDSVLVEDTEDVEEEED